MSEQTWHIEPITPDMAAESRKLAWTDTGLQPIFTGDILDFANVFPEAPEPDFRFDGFHVDAGPMSISHWGMIDLGRFGVVYMPDGAHWQEGGKTFAVVPGLSDHD